MRGLGPVLVMRAREPQENLIPTLSSAVTLHSPRPTEGRFARRTLGGTGCGARGLVHVSEHSGGVGAPPGTNRSPRWEPADEAKPEVDPDSVEKARPDAASHRK
jgi:hypothetical protein